MAELERKDPVPREVTHVCGTWCCSLVPLHRGLPGGGWGFLTAQWLGFRVEAASFLASGQGHWPSVHFCCIVLVKLSQGPDSKRRDRELTFLWEVCPVILGPGSTYRKQWYKNIYVTINGKSAATHESDL